MVVNVTVEPRDKVNPKVFYRLLVQRFSPPRSKWDKVPLTPKLYLKIILSFGKTLSL